MNRTDALARLHDAAAMWSAGFDGPEPVVLAACDVLVSGDDGRALSMLAALPLRTLDDRDVEDLLEQALAEVGLPCFVPHSREAEQARRITNYEVKAASKNPKGVPGSVPPEAPEGAVHDGRGVVQEI
ncbi:hypothetical protein [Asanoa siamensis]|uniref:Uncharacterized protein n=1 Tax=Asanoa siamensis TaxID=926357 RepID=A0ABQ4CW83_9ACTN|nr:hypothetical protein [Asanoa siamensis]GIF75520.1 hypothetical protein Asi02nite_50380 [Asanoa siamensis]